MLNFKFIKPKKDSSNIEKQEDELLKKLASQDLNKIIIERLIKKVEALLDKDVVNAEEINELLNEISSFFDSESTDPIQDVLNKYYNSLKHQAEGEINVLLKGKVVFDNAADNDFSKVRITVFSNTGAKKVIFSGKPTLKDGKYYVILKPAKRYSISIECFGYQKTSRDFSVSGSPESYELSQEIVLKK
jgi:hypothetical protein